MLQMQQQAMEAAAATAAAATAAAAITAVSFLLWLVMVFAVLNSKCMECHPNPPRAAQSFKPKI